MFLFVVLGMLLSPLSARADDNTGDYYKRFTQLYVDAVASTLTGLSTTQTYTVGWRKEQQGFYLQVQDAWSDTRGSASLYQYLVEGVTISGGVRYWLPGNAWYVYAADGAVVRGPYAGQYDARAGLVGYNEWEYGRRKVLDLYSDCTYVRLDKDTYFTLRVRDGKILRQSGNSRTWAFLVGNVQADTAGSNGLSNRLETGVGLGFRTYKAPYGLSLSLEYRVGHSFAGAITHQNYTYPLFIIAGGF